MTRKDYQLIATSLGATLRTCEEESAGYYTILQAAQELAADLKRDNSRFDADRFVDWVRAVGHGARDLEGRKVTA